MGKDRSIIKLLSLSGNTKKNRIAVKTMEQRREKRRTEWTVNNNKLTNYKIAIKK